MWEHRKSTIDFNGCVWYALNMSNQDKPFTPPLDISALKPPMNVKVISQVEDLKLLTDFFSRRKEFGFDLETNVVHDLNKRYVRTIQAGDRDEQYVIDLMAFARSATQTIDLDPVTICQKAQRDPELRRQVFGPIIDVLRPVLDSRDWLKLAHHAQFEYENMKLCFNIRMWNIWDTFLAEQIILCGFIPAKAVGHYALDERTRR